MKITNATPPTVLDTCPRCGAPTGTRCYDLRRGYKMEARAYHQVRDVLRPDATTIAPDPMRKL